MVDVLHTPLKHLRDSNACPTVTVTPETVKAAFTKESNVFAEHGVEYFNTLVNFGDRKLLARLFGAEVRAGVIRDPLETQDVWKNSYSASTNHKVWAAKFTARHPNLVALELSSFKCGHDAPIYTVIESIIERSGTPYFSFKHIDENKPSGSIKIRVETIHYFLKRYAEDMNRKRDAKVEIDQQIAADEQQLRKQLLFDEALAELGARQREELSHRRLLPVVPLGQGAAPDIADARAYSVVS